MLILARLLSPAEFGLIGMLTLFIALGSSIVDSGFGSALIQRKEITEADKSSVFLFQCGDGRIDGVGDFFRSTMDRRVLSGANSSPMTRWMALNLFIGFIWRGPGGAPDTRPRLPNTV